jgi:hypothetical protein
MVHILIGGLLGVVAMSISFGQSKAGSTAATVVALSAAVASIAGALVGLSPYQEYPLPAAIAAGTVEIGLVVVHH